MARSEASRERKRELHEQHRCSQCGGQDADTLSGSWQCRCCADYHSVKSQIAHGNRREHGLCIECGKPVDEPGACRCDSCAERKNAAEKIVREERKSAGLCRDCGKPVDDRRFVRCSACRERQSIAKRRRMFREVMES